MKKAVQVYEETNKDYFCYFGSSFINNNRIFLYLQKFSKGEELTTPVSQATSEIVSSVSIDEELTSVIEVQTEETQEEPVQSTVDDSKKYSMSLKELREAGYIEGLCEKYGMSLYAFDTISTVESSYGVHCYKGNAWGWQNNGGYYGLADNWYDASEIFIQKFVNSPHYNHGWPSKQNMRTYCPSGAYDRYFD